MEITELIWLDEIVEKIESKHHGEYVYRALGRSAAGRHLAVFFIHKLTGEALILSARDMDNKERSSYAKG